MMKALATITLCILFSGCQSFIAHDKQTGHIYPGVNTDLFIIKCLWASAVKPPEGESRAAWVPLAGLGTIVYGVDVPFSFILDTALLPIDIPEEGNPEVRATLSASCEKPENEKT